METRIKYLNHLATQLAGERHMRTTYTTNRAFKALETFTHLRNLTTSNSIALTNVKQLRKVTGVCYNTMHTRLQWAQDLQLVTLVGKRLYFNSYERIALYYGLPVAFTHYNHDTQKTKLEFLFKAIVFAENKQSQHQGFSKRVDRNPKTREQLTHLGCTPQELNNATALRNFVLYKQHKCLTNVGLDGYDFIMNLRADDNISNKGLGHLLTRVRRNSELTPKDIAWLKTTGGYFRRSCAKAGVILSQNANIINAHTRMPHIAGKVNPHVTMRYLVKQNKREFLKPMHVTVLVNEAPKVQLKKVA
jgi:hypothetical protein